MSAKYPCPCCGFLTLDEKPPATFDICLVCGWEDDNVQYDDPTFRGGANVMSLDEARENFRRYRVKDPKQRTLVRDPRPDETPPSPGR